jgi:cold-inducible RNA-binding protein
MPAICGLHVLGFVKNSCAFWSSRCDAIPACSGHGVCGLSILEKPRDAPLRVYAAEFKRGDLVSKKLYVGNLAFKTTEDEIKALFSEIGPVESVNFIRDFDTGRARGFAFVEVESDDCSKMIAQFNGKEVNGRALVVNEARPRNDSGARGGFRK